MKMKTGKCIFSAVLFAFAALLSAVEPGGTLKHEDLTSAATKVLSARSTEKMEPQYDVILFFDVLAPDAVNALRMMDGIPDIFPAQKIRVSAFARNSEGTVAEALGRFHTELLNVYADDAKGSLFNAFMRGEVVIPIAVIVQDEKIRWKGAPTDAESVLGRMISGSFSLQKQVRINMLRNDLQGAVQAGLPEVILRSADEILKVDPADTLAIQAKLYVLEGRKREDLAKAFLAEQVKKAPDNVTLRLFLLDLMVNTGDRDGFRNALTAALNEMKADVFSVTRLLGFSLNNAPLGWVPLADANAAAAGLSAGMTELSPRVQAYRLEITARLAYFSMRIDDAVRMQESAAKIYPAGNAGIMLDYYRSVKALNGK